MPYRKMTEETRINFLRSDIVTPTVIYEAASRIFSVHIQRNAVNDENEKDMMRTSVIQALELALTTDELVAGGGSSERGESRL